jgi:hypothetical protein
MTAPALKLQQQLPIQNWGEQYLKFVYRSKTFSTNRPIAEHTGISKRLLSEKARLKISDRPHN